MEKGTITYKQKTNEEYMNAIQQSRGSMAEVARILGMTRPGVVWKINRNPELKRMFDQQLEAEGDRAESRIHKLMDSQDENISLRATQYYLNSRHKDRGYGNQITVYNNSVNLNIGFDTGKLSMDEKMKLLELLNKGEEEDQNDGIIDGKFNDDEGDALQPEFN